MYNLNTSYFRYLPYPGEIPIKDKVISSYNPELCSFVFKTLHDKQLGPLTFLRVFQGTLKASQKIFNASKDKTEKVLKLYQPLADDLKEIDEVTPGQVAVVSGLTVSCTFYTSYLKLKTFNTYLCILL